MTNKYTELKNKNQEKINNFPQFFAFDETQLQEGLKKLNTTKDKICSTFGGGFIKKSDSKKYFQMWKEINENEKEARKDDDYLYSAFRYELSNHEFIITYDYTDALNALNLEYNKLTKRELNILSQAEKDYLNAVE